ncbi:5-methylcytosine rRNA methyltransferase NSUN4-like [Patiria miniata]|uniref:NOL1/NOP2/Sun domain family member 4 n=1 Tax=Patiria miniata TaxID=46514 RepID=A0A914BRR8_PATMI|nr:5-methylcytosine rRNA methyltransferase NSUN4-like [Patiria miniata]
MSFWRCLGAVNVLSRRGTLQVVHVPRRWKKTKKKWQTIQTQRKSEPSFHALRHFDENYRHQFGDAWPSIRLGLLSPQKYGALVNNYGIAEETEEFLQSLGAEDFIQPAARELLKKMMVDQSVLEDALMSESEDASDSSSESSDEESNIGISSLSDDTLQNSEHSGQMNPIEDFTKLQTKSETGQPKRPWDEKYIVMPGYEAKMEYLMSADAVGHRELDSAQTVQEMDLEHIHRPLTISQHLKCFVYGSGSLERFPPSKMDSGGLFLQYYAMDAASVLPVIALDVRPRDLVLDLCAAPGGKALAIMQTMLADGLVANEPEAPRRRRLQNVLRQYVGFDRQSSSEVLRITTEDGRRWGEMEPDTYDKVLVDVPCTTDRLSVTNNDNSIFAVSRTNERWELPKLQSELLCAGLKAVKPGGDVVYSTCSLSQQQNDAVVESALYHCQSETNMEVAVVDLSPLTQCLGHVFKFWDRAKHGQLVLPNVNKNFGPMYFCKLHRVR